MKTNPDTRRPGIVRSLADADTAAVEARFAEPGTPELRTMYHVARDGTYLFRRGDTPGSSTP